MDELTIHYNVWLSENQRLNPNHLLWWKTNTVYVITIMQNFHYLYYKYEQRDFTMNRLLPKFINNG